MNNDIRPKGWLKKLTERILSEPDNTAEDSEKFRADREALLGTTRQWAVMQPDFTIARDLIQWLPDGTRGHGASVSAPGNPDYEELCNLHNLQKPGDASTIFKRLIDGEWVVVDDLE